MAQGILNLEMELKSSAMSASSSTSLGSSDHVNGTLQRKVRCPICLMKFKDPRRLPCEHTFCKDCLKGVLKRQKDDGIQLTCLICQNEVTLNKEGVEGLDNAIYTQSIREIYQAKKKIKCSKCNGKYCKFCVQVTCGKCSKYISSMYCKSCDKCLCSKCTREHNQRGHSISDIEEAHRLMKMENQEDDDNDDERWERDSGSSRDSDGEVAQSYNVTIEEDEIQSTNGGSNNEDSDKDSDEATGLYQIGHQQDHSDEDDSSSEGNTTDEIENINIERSGNTMERSSTPERSSNTNTEETDEENPLNHDNNETINDEINVADQSQDITIETIEADGPITMIDDDSELNELVNETVQTQLQPSQVVQLRPSAPQNTKRKSQLITNHMWYRTSQAIPDQHVPEYEGPPRYREIRSLKWCSRIIIGFVFVLVFCVLAFGGLSLTAFLLSPRNETAFIFEGEVILLSQAEPFWVRDITFNSRGPYNTLYYYNAEFNMIDCQRLKTVNTTYQLTYSGAQPANVRDLTIDIPTGKQGHYPYLLPGSVVTLSIYISSDTTYQSCASELNIYDNYDDFIAERGINAVQTNCVNVHKVPSSAPPTLVTFRPQKSSFYFFTLSIPPTARYDINATIDLVSYANVSIIIQKCDITSTEQTLSDSCTFQLLTDNEIVTNIQSTCIIATTTPRPPTTTPSYIKLTITSTPNIFRNIGYLMTPIPIFIYFFLCLIVWLCFKGCIACCYRCKHQLQKRSVHEYATI